MNLTTPLALYASITSELHEPLYFPGNPRFYTGFDTLSYAPLIAQFQIWCALTPAAGGEGFNIVNGDTASWQRMWPRLAKRFGCKVPERQFAEPRGPFYDESVLSEHPPLEDQAVASGLVGLVERGRRVNRISLTKWAEREEVKQAWERICAREGLEREAFAQATWTFADFVLGRGYDTIQSMSKARKLGWTGYVDTWESFEATFDELEANKVIPTRDR
ncbi:hypothetical protein CALVIDRAFT_537144 [Calocera viscosa TUFC12733]|uniref:Uncharacterized protein n=1 Tax=Calocera viscosa (strain TUFC12733) TaxID=1330018 RepID=A0A167M616_CALVF|nr:hypothetical protein CALVIDRAFT_537144 [Calocera viscosa TUFC12733]